MASATRVATIFLLVALAQACAQMAGIEAGHLRDDVSTASGTAGAIEPTSAGSATTQSGGSGALGGSPSVGGSAGELSRSGAAGSNDGASASGGTSAGSAGALGGEGGGASCPSDMVLATSTLGDRFCIDALETTNAQYLTFTQAHTATSATQIAACSTNSTFLPSSGCAGALNDVPSRAVPVVCVDWCDAAAFCAAAGKRLCGRIGGVENPPQEAADSEACEWYAACVGSDARTQSGSVCNDSSFDTNATKPKAASKIPNCEGGVPGLFDMSGNVAEWENSCDDAGPASACNTRGGSFHDGPYELMCGSSNSAARLSQSPTIGIRCCAAAE